MCRQMRERLPNQENATQRVDFGSPLDPPEFHKISSISFAVLTTCVYYVRASGMPHWVRFLSR